MSNGSIDWAAVGRRIRAAYMRAGFNRTQFAKVIDVHPTAIMAWEKGRPIKTENLEIVAEMTGTTSQYLLFGTTMTATEPRESGEVAVGPRPAALDDFLASPAAEGISEEHRAALEAYRWPREPSFTSYMLMYQALRAQLSPEDAARAAEHTERVRESARSKRLGKHKKPHSRNGGN